MLLFYAAPFFLFGSDHAIEVSVGLFLVSVLVAREALLQVVRLLTPVIEPARDNDSLHDLKFASLDKVHIVKGTSLLADDFSFYGLHGPQLLRKFHQRRLSFALKSFSVFQVIVSHLND